MVELMDLMEIYKVKHNKTSTLSLLTDIMNTSNIDERIDKEILASVLLAECGNVPVRWNVTDVFYSMGVTFFRAHSIEFGKKLNAIYANYNILDSYVQSRISNEKTERNETKEKTITNDMNELTTNNLTEVNGNSVTTRRISADNEAVFVNREQNETLNPTINNTGTVSIDNTGTQSFAENNEHTDDKEFFEESHGRNESAINLLKNEIDFACYNLYNDIATQFAEFMCICVY